MHGRGGQPDGQNALYVRQPVHPAGGDPHLGRGWAGRRAAALPESGGLVRPCAGAQGGDARHPSRRQGPVEVRYPRRQPGLGGGAQGMDNLLLHWIAKSIKSLPARRGGFLL